MSMQPRAVVERYLAEVLNGEGPARPEDLISGQTLRQRTTGFRRAFPDLQATTHTLLVDGDLVTRTSAVAESTGATLPVATASRPCVDPGRLQERITSPLTVGGDLGKGRSAQR
jgi:hypothetical protein